MGLVNSLSYAFKSVVKNRRRSLYAVIGIILAISFFSGSFIAVDSSSYSMIRSRMDTVPIDFTGNSYSFIYYDPIDLAEIRSAVDDFSTVDGIEEVETYIRYAEWEVAAPNTATYNDSIYFHGKTGIFLSDDSDKLLASYGITGAVPKPGTLAMSKELADIRGLKVGDSVDLISAHTDYNNTYYNGGYNYQYVTEYVTFKYVLSEIWTQEGFDDYYPPYYYPVAGVAEESQGVPASILSDSVNFVDYMSNPIIFNIEDMNALYSARNSALGNLEGRYLSFCAWVDRDSVVPAGDLSGALARLDYIRNRLDLKGQNYGYVSFNDALGNSLQGLNRNMDSYKTLFFALSLPVMLLGSYLSVVGVDLATSDRRREIGIRKARGATKRQVIGEMAFESILLGAVAGIVGLLGGIFISRTLLNVSSSFLGADLAEVSITDFVISGGTILATVFFGVFLMLISSYRPIKRLSNLEVAESLHFFVASEAKKEYHMKWDIIALALSALSIISVWTLTQRWYNSGYYYGPGSFIIQILLIVSLVLGVALLPMLPLLLSVSVIRLLTRGPRKIYKKLAVIVKPWTKNVHYLVEMNLERNPKRSSMMCMVIALAIAFGLFVSVTMESSLAYEVNKIKYSVGADINAEILFYNGDQYYNGQVVPKNYNIAALSGLESSAGIESSCRVYELHSDSYTGYYGYYDMIETENYRKTVRPDDFWFIDSNAGILDRVAQGGKALVRDSYARSRSLEIGDSVALTQSFSPQGYASYTIKVNVEIIGMINGLPGISAESFVFDRKTFDVTEKTLLEASNTNIGFGFLANLKTGSDHDAVGANIKSILIDSGGGGAYIRDLDTELSHIYSNPTYGALTQFFNTEYAVSMAIMTVGVAMIIFVSVSERRQEIACIMARGSSGPQMGKILMGESVSLMVLGLTVGTIVGLLTAFLFNYLTAGLSNQVGHNVVLTFVTLSILIVAVASMLIASFLSTVRASRIKLAEILRIRGG